MPDMTGAFVTDIDHILGQMNEWLQGAVLGGPSGQSRLAVIILDHLQDKNGDESLVYAHLNKLVETKCNLFNQFARAVRKQIMFFRIAKVRGMFTWMNKFLNFSIARRSVASVSPHPKVPVKCVPICCWFV